MDPQTRRIFTSRREFQNELRDAFAQAASSGAREIWLCDVDFKHWPLSEGAVIESLTRWAQSNCRLTLLAHTYDEIVRSHGRWIEWRRAWSHRIDCRTNHELDAAQMPTICLVPGSVSVRLVDSVQSRGIASTDNADAVACRELIDAVLQRSAEAFPATTLGL